MNKEQAEQMIRNVLDEIRLTKKDHAALDQALAVLVAVEKKKKDK